MLNVAVYLLADERMGAKHYLYWLRDLQITWVYSAKGKFP